MARFATFGGKCGGSWRAAATGWPIGFVGLLAAANDAHADPLSGVQTRGAQSVEVLPEEEAPAEARERSAEAVTAVDLATARRQTADLAEVWARTAGVNVRRFGALGSEVLFLLDGLEGHQVPVFIDGVPAELRYAIVDYPVNSFERVEFYRGVVPVRFGADALGGAVNLVSASSHRTLSRASYRIGSFGTHRITAESRFRHAASGLTLAFQTYGDGALNNYPIRVEIPRDNRVEHATVKRFHDRYDAGGLSVEAGFVGAPWTRKLTLRAFLNGYDKELQHDPAMRVPYGRVHYGATLKGLELRWEQGLGPNLDVGLVASVTNRVYHFVDASAYSYDWFGAPHLRPVKPGPDRPDELTISDGERGLGLTEQREERTSLYARPSVEWRPVPGHALRLTLTPLYSSRTLRETLVAGLDSDRELFTLVSGLEYALDDFLPLPEAVRSRNPRGETPVQGVLFVKDYRYFAASKPSGTSEQDPREVTRSAFGVGGGVRFRMRDWILFKVSGERAVRLPDPYEVFGDDRAHAPNTALKSEVSTNGNLGFHIQHAWPDSYRSLKADVNAFVRNTQNRIAVDHAPLDSPNTKYLWQSVNAEPVQRTRGVEASVSLRALRALLLEGSVTYLDQRWIQKNSDRPESGRLPNSPWFYASWSARYTLSGLFDRRDELEPFYTGRFVHAYDSLLLDGTTPRAPSQLIQGVGLTYAVHRRFGGVASTFEVQNFTDTRLYDVLTIQRPGRSLALKLSAEL